MGICRFVALVASVFQDGPSAVDSVITIPLPVQPPGPGRDRNACSAVREFLAGPENRLVEPAVRSVLDDSPNGYNPLVFYGPSGTGKSHVAQGLAAAWKAHYRRRRVLYTTADDFLRELADAVETQATDEFCNRYRTAALLVLEDIDRLAGEDDTQEELVHTLDALLAAGNRVVVTASGAPARLSGIIPRLQSRLEGGLTVPLVPPGTGVRRAILGQLAGLRKMDLSESAADVLAEGLPVTVPELVDVLVQLEVWTRLQGGTVDTDAARRFLGLGQGTRRTGLREIAAATAQLFALKLSDLRGASRRQAVVTARGVAMYLARQLTSNSLEQIGRFFGGRDHTTVMYGCRKTEKLLLADPAICRAVQQLWKKLQHTQAPEDRGMRPSGLV